MKLDDSIKNGHINLLYLRSKNLRDKLESNRTITLNSCVIGRDTNYAGIRREILADLTFTRNDNDVISVTSANHRMSAEDKDIDINGIKEVADLVGTDIAYVDDNLLMKSLDRHVMIPSRDKSSMLSLRIATKGGKYLAAGARYLCKVTSRGASIASKTMGKGMMAARMVESQMKVDQALSGM